MHFQIIIIIIWILLMVPFLFHIFFILHFRWWGAIVACCCFFFFMLYTSNPYRNRQHVRYMALCVHYRWKLLACYITQNYCLCQTQTNTQFGPYKFTTCSFFLTYFYFRIIALYYFHFSSKIIIVILFILKNEYWEIENKNDANCLTTTTN